MHLVFLMRPEPSNSMPATKIGQQRENRGKHLGGPKKSIFFRKSTNFQSLMRGTAKRHGVLHIRAHLVAKGVLGHMRQIDPISTCTEGKSANFSKYGFSPEPTLGYVRVDSPQNTTGDLQNTPGTPAVHFPLVASGSQSALYAWGSRWRWCR